MSKSRNIAVMYHNAAQLALQSTEEEFTSYPSLPFHRFKFKRNVRNNNNLYKV